MQNQFSIAWSFGEYCGMFDRQSRNVAGSSASFLSGGDGPPLVYLHAASGPRITTGLERLARTRRLCIPVAPGFENTPLFLDEAGVDGLARWLHAFISAVFGRPVDVAGHSFGGWLGCWLAAERPEIIGRLVLVSPAGFNPEDGQALEGDPTTLLARAFAHPERRRPETRAPELIAANRTAAAHYARGTAFDHRLVEKLAGIGTATRVVYGEKDGVVAPSCPALLERLLPNVDVVTVADAAHNVDVDQPDAFASAVDGFLVAAGSRRASTPA